MLSECTLQPVVSCMKNVLPGLHLSRLVSYCISLQLLEGAQDKETSYEEFKQEIQSQ